MLISSAVSCWAEEAGQPDLGASSLKALGALLLVLTLIFLAAWLAKKYLRFLPQNTAKGEGIQVLSARSLGPKRSVHLIEVQGRRLLVGSSEAGVILLKDYSMTPRNDMGET
jgi:flagellar biosynthetic protein FliO